MASDSTTLISEGTELSGDISFSGTLEILGTVTGNIISEQKDARVRVLNGGSVEGDIKAAIIEVNGTIKGNIFAIDRLCLEPNCTVTGNIHYSNMEMRSGAQLVGSCNYQQMTPAKEIPSQTAVNSEKVKEIRNNNQQTLDKQWQ
ncbi:MAG: bactofilin family protein [Porticoccaceae bacterium]